jgi:hypothetical protein
MAYVLLGILVIGLFASIYVAVMSSKTWPIYQTVLVVFVFIAAMVFFYFGARTLKTHQAWRQLYKNNLAQAEQLEAQILPLTGGVDPQGHSVAGDIPRLEQELSQAVRARGGGVFYNVKATGLADGVLSVTLAPAGSLPPVEKPAAAPGEAGAEGAEVDVAADQPPAETPPAEGAPAEGQPAAAAGEASAIAHGLVPGSIVFAFEQKSAQAGGRYLGEFKVTEGAGDNPNLKLAANLPLTDAQAKRLEAAANETLVLYTTMPPDDAQIFAAMDPAKRAEMLPPSLAEEYASADRPLHDFLTFFHEDYVQRGLISDTISQTTSNIQRIEAATAEVAKEATFRETEKTNLAAELTGFERETEAIAAYRKSLEDLLAQTRTQLKATYVENRNAAATLTRAQLEAADEINRRTNLAAQ